MKCGDCSLKEDVSDLEHMELCPLNWGIVNRSSWGGVSVDLSDRDCIDNEKRQLLLRLGIVKLKQDVRVINKTIRRSQKELEL